MSNVVIQDLLLQFVAPSYHHRTYLRHIIHRGEYLYATNGVWLVRVPFCAGVEAIESEEPKALEDMLPRYRCDQFVTNIPDLPELKSCASCNGTGSAYTCPQCNGAGEFAEDDPCCTCEGSCQVSSGKEEARTDCWFCDGMGTHQDRVSIGTKDFDPRYLTKIKALPGVRFSPGPDDDPWAAGYFTFDGGGEGLLMPMRK